MSLCPYGLWRPIFCPWLTFFPSPRKKEISQPKLWDFCSLELLKKYFSKTILQSRHLHVTLAYHYRQKLNHFSSKLLRRFVSRAAERDTWKKMASVNNLKELQIKLNTSWNSKIYYRLRIRTDAANKVRLNERSRTVENSWSFSLLQNFKTGHVVVFCRNFNETSAQTKKKNVLTRWLTTSLTMISLLKLATADSKPQANVS